MLLFLTEYTSFHNLALTQVKIIKKKFDLSLIEKILLIRFESKLQILKFESSESDLFQQEDELNDIRLRKLNSSIEFLIEKTIISLTLFWEYLKEERPDVKVIGQNIEDSSKNVSKLLEFWEKNPQINESNLKSKFIYGIFLVEILHKKEDGMKILKDFHQRKKQIMTSLLDLKNITLKNIRKFANNPASICILKKVNSEIFIFSCTTNFALCLKRLKEDIEGKPISVFIKKISSNYFNNIFLSEENLINQILVLKIGDKKNFYEFVFFISYF